MISANDYPFLVSPDLTCHLEDIRIGDFGCTVRPDSKETELGNGDQEASPSADKNTEKILKLCGAWKCVPTAISEGVDISEFPGCFVTTDEFSVGDTKITPRIDVS